VYNEIIMRKAFTLIELLIVVAIVAMLAVVVFLVLNPTLLIRESHDANRVADLNVLATNIERYIQMNLGSLGTSTVIYISVPDPTATTTAGTNCSGLGLVGNYHCAASSTYQNVNGTGWLPINFSGLPGGPSFSSLPVDPVNTTSSGEYYKYTTDGITQWEAAANPESPKYASQTSSFVVGTTKNLAGW
jgi:prepilin-type N-terminal cleavage/methylation domain-containing protein